MARRDPEPQAPFSLSGLAPEDALRRLELHIVRRLEGFLHGEHLGLLPGPGTDMAEARVYNAGADDVRRMDWAVTARTTIPHVRDVIADRELETWALIDLSASMQFGTATMEKRDLAIAALATMGLLTSRVGDRFGSYVLRGESLRRWPARSGRRALFSLMRHVLNDDPGQGATGLAVRDLSSSIEHLARGQRRRGLRVVISDFLDPSDVLLGTHRAKTWERPMRELSTRHQAIAVEVIDPRELELPNVGVVLLTDPETGALRELNTGDRRVRERFADAAREQRANNRTAFRRAGVSHLVLRTDRDWVQELARFALEHRRVGARQPRLPVVGAASSTRRR